jgi:hypothetical protein
MKSPELPAMVVAADWSIKDQKRWMARGTLQPEGAYLVFPPEPVGEVKTLLGRLRLQAPNGSLVIGFDFPIGLPQAYADRGGYRSFREALGKMDERFFAVTDTPRPQQPFYPPPTQEEGKYPKVELANGLGVPRVTDLLRRCDHKTAVRREAECLFFTCGGKQVGCSAIIGWRDVIQPAMDEVCLWPFDGEYKELLEQEKVVIVEIYPAEAYSHLGFQMGRAEQSKTQRHGRQKVASHLMKAQSDRIRISHAAQSWIEWGFRDEDDFDAMVSLLSMLQVVTGTRSADVPKDEAVRKMEGWIFGQEAAGAQRAG